MFGLVALFVGLMCEGEGEDVDGVVCHEHGVGCVGVVVVWLCSSIPFSSVLFDEVDPLSID